jgi:hypothetical protein
MEPINNNVSQKWSRADEDLLKEWADHAICYKWLHEKAHVKFDKIYTYMNIPIIIISTITGTANFAQGKIADATLRDLVAMLIGTLSIITGIIATASSFFKIAERKESHSNCAKLWDKFHRNVQVEMVKPPSQRMPKKTMMELTKKEYDRFVENSPMIPEDIIKLFSDTFNGIEIKPGMEKFKKPNILNILEPILVQNEELIKSDSNEIDAKFSNIYGRKPTEFERNTIIELNNVGQQQQQLEDVKIHVE